MPQGIFAWQEKGHREAHPEGERETGRRPRGSAGAPSWDRRLFSIGMGKAGSVRMAPGAGGGNEPGEQGRRALLPATAGEGRGRAAACPGAGKRISPGRPGEMEKMLCGAPNQGGRNCPGAMGGSPVPCATAGRAGLFPQKRERKRPGKHLPGLSFVSRRRSRAFARSLYYFNESFP